MTVAAAPYGHASGTARRHCCAASPLPQTFRYSSLPSTVVKIAVVPLRFAQLPGAAASRVCWEVCAMVAIGAVASAGQPTTVHGWAAVGVSGVGVLFVLIGLVLATNFKGFAHKWVDSSEHSPEWLHRANVALHGGEENHERFKREVTPKIVGWGFMALGAMAAVAGIVDLVSK